MSRGEGAVGGGAHGDGGGPGRVQASPRSLLRGAELGEFALHLHSYLLLLDYSKAAYPTKACDAIHDELQDLLRQGELGVAEQVRLLSSVKERHAALAKLL